MASFLLFVHLISFTCSITSNPKNETLTAQYYWASLDPIGFNFDIICASNKDCFIYCDMSNRCNRAKIYAENAKNLYLYCSAVSSCTNIMVFGTNAPTATTNIYCLAPTACSNYPMFALNTTSNVNIICNSTSTNIGTGACKTSSIFVPNQVKSVQIECGLFDCNQIEIFTQYSAYNTFLTCNGANSCIDSQITCTHGNGRSDLIFRNVEWQCNDRSCCPLTSSLISSNDQILCELCNEFDCTLNECANAYIDGQNVKNSLTVSCESSNDCKQSKISCPIDAECFVDCLGFESCANALIDASESTKLYLKCGHYGCFKTNVLCPFGMNDCVIECLEEDFACNQMQIIQKHESSQLYLDLKCPAKFLNFVNSCADIRFFCDFGVFDNAYYLWSDTQSNGCIDPMSSCCPWPLTTTSLSPTKGPTQKPIFIPSIVLLPPPPQTTISVTDNAGVSDKNGNDNLLIIVVIIGFSVLSLCVCVWGLICWNQRRKQNGVHGMGTSSHHANDRYVKRNKKETMVSTPSAQVNVELEKSLEVIPDQGVTTPLAMMAASETRLIHLDQSMDMNANTYTQSGITILMPPTSPY